MKDKITVEQEWFNKFTLEEKAIFLRRMLDELSKCRNNVFTPLDISYAINIVSAAFSQYQERQIYDAISDIAEIISQQHRRSK